jgi:hypothetical protein
MSGTVGALKGRWYCPLRHLGLLVLPDKGTRTVLESRGCRTSAGDAAANPVFAHRTRPEANWLRENRCPGANPGVAGRLNGEVVDVLAIGSGLVRGCQTITRGLAKSLGQLGNRYCPGGSITGGTESLTDGDRSHSQDLDEPFSLSSMDIPATLTGRLKTLGAR